MIASKVIDDYHFPSKEKKYIVDTNILLYAYGNGNINKSKSKERLSIVLANALDCNCDVFIPSIVMSEYINRFHRDYFNKNMKKYGWKSNEYKTKYRNSEKFKENNEFLYRNINDNFISRFKLISDSFEEVSITNIISLNDNQDFNDNLIIHIANKNNLYIISDDIDTKKINI